MTTITSAVTKTFKGTHTHPCPVCQTAVPCDGVLQDNPAGADFEKICLTDAVMCGRCQVTAITERMHWGEVSPPAIATREEQGEALTVRAGEITALTEEVKRLRQQVADGRVEMQQLREAVRQLKATTATPKNAE